MVVEMARGEAPVAGPVETLDLSFVIHRNPFGRRTTQAPVQQASLAFLIEPSAPAAERPFAHAQHLRCFHLGEVLTVIPAQDRPKPDHSHTLQRFRPAHLRPQKGQNLTDRSCAT